MKVLIGIRRILRRSLIYPTVFVAMFAIWSGPASAENRWALVLGISEYENAHIPSLKNTVNDARTISASLNNMGFEVYYLENAKKLEFEAVVEKISREQPNADIGLFYFAGHGVQIAGENYAMPSDIQPQGSSFIQDQGISVNKVIKRLNDIGTQNLVVILDSCRNSPFPEQEAVGTGLALVDAPDNTIIAYSTSPGAVALDGTGANSPYTAALASDLEGPEQDIRDVLRLVRARVRLATRGEQTPWFIDNSKNEIVIQPRRPVSEDTLSAVLSGRVISLPTTAWRTIAASSDPRDFEQFASLFPNDDLIETANRRLVLVSSDGAPNFPLMNIQIQGTGQPVQNGLLSEITPCDILATGVGDITALVEPVPHDLVNSRAALRACVEAVQNEPENGRLVNLLARVLRIDKRFEEAFHYFERAAELGNPTAYAGISAFYRQGIGVERDYERALAAARTGALAGSPRLRLLTGIFYREGWGTEQSFSEAQRWTRLSVMGGFAPAVVAYGDFFRKGLGVEPNQELAVIYYRQAAALGSSDAVNLVGMAYMRGKGVKRNTDEGIKWLIRASDDGNPYASFGLGRAFNDGWGVEKDTNQALAFFRLSAQRNYLGAYNYIGDILSEGTTNRPPNLPEAYANYIIAREAAIVRGTLDAKSELADAEQRINDILARMSPEQRAEGEHLAEIWITQYGLLDFNLVNE